MGSLFPGTPEIGYPGARQALRAGVQALREPLGVSESRNAVIFLVSPIVDSYAASA